VQETEAFLALVDDTLVSWAKRESVELSTHNRNVP